MRRFAARSVDRSGLPISLSTCLLRVALAERQVLLTMAQLAVQLHVRLAGMGGTSIPSPAVKMCLLARRKCDASCIGGSAAIAQFAYLFTSLYIRRKPIQVVGIRKPQRLWVSASIAAPLAYSDGKVRMLNILLNVSGSNIGPEKIITRDFG